ncbi:MAG: sigma-70 family RNA polymerase sigma factor [Isosphaeraceae bacterium]
MAQSSYGTAFRHIHTLFNVGTIGGLTDGQLLERFTSSNDEAAELAFAALVERHGPMVLRVCQSVLRERHDAEDAFQATFLILVRKAASIRKQSSVVSWLHGVALRVASCQKGATARRRRHERKVAERPAASADGADADELASVLHEELDRLPEKYRSPIVLCYFESLSHEQAASRLCWPVGTVRSRLARGREQLRGRLLRRGLAPSIVLLERSLSAETARAAIPPALANATAHAALHYASGKLVATGVTSTSVALLLEGAMNVMFLAKMKFALLACGLIATGAFVVAQQVRTPVPLATAQATSAGVSDNSPERTGALDENAAVASELGRLDLELLADEVRQLREQVEAALRKKLRAERTDSAGSMDAQSAFEAARASYLAKARELRTAQRRLTNAREQREPAPLEPAGLSAPRDDRGVRGPSTDKPEPRPTAAAIGSIDMDAVFKRYQKVEVLDKERRAARLVLDNELKKISSEAQEERRMLSKLVPGSIDYRKHENRITELKARYQAGCEQAERALTLREAEAAAILYNEIQETVAALAKAKGLTYVVKVSPVPRPDTQPNDLTNALNRSVVYADPGNDVTEEVIRELNRRFKAGGAKTAR